MTTGHFSLILLPTLQCNAHCQYCFETENDAQMGLGDLSRLALKLVEYLDRNNVGSLSIFWQGGEVMTLAPDWFEQAQSIIRKANGSNERRIAHYLQSNMLAYGREWDPVLRGMFNNSVGSSMDFPNLHRRLKGGTADEYEHIWTEKILMAREAGIEVGVIAIPNLQTLKLGAERFYSYFTERLGIKDFQVNTPFPGGKSNAIKEGYPLPVDPLKEFYTDLGNIWLERGYHQGVRVGPFDRLVNYFLHDDPTLPCMWRRNCADEFVCIDPHGRVSQCDCWVTSYPDFRFGNIFESESLSDLLRGSEARRQLHSRPAALIGQTDCIDCEHLSICHGGCPIRTYSVHGSLIEKDPYCELYRSLFRQSESMAAHIAGSSSITI